VAIQATSAFLGGEESKEAVGGAVTSGGDERRSVGRGEGQKLPGSTIAGLAGPITPFLNLSGISTTGLTSAHVGAAVSAAASEVLIALYPDFRQIVDDALRGFDFPASDPGWQFGIQVAQHALQDRSNDGSDEGGGVPEINRYWRHREDPTALGQGLLGARWGTVRLFSASAIPPIAHHPVPRSNAYNRAHDQVRAKGSRILEEGTPGAGFSPRTIRHRLGTGASWPSRGVRSRVPP